jgi:hypothetical protein
VPRHFLGVLRAECVGELERRDVRSLGGGEFNCQLGSFRIVFGVEN